MSSRSKAIPFLIGGILAVSLSGRTGATETTPGSRLVADVVGAGGVTLCLTVDADKPLAGPFTVPAASPDGKPHIAPGPFYPVVVNPCEGGGAGAPVMWTATNERELRVQFKGQSMCLTERPLTSFLPLIDAYLDAFKASQPGSPFAYLMDDWKPNGQVNTKRADFAPDLVVGACGQADAQDFWVYDDLSGTLSGPGGPGRRRPCVTIHTDRRATTTDIASGTPVSAAACPDSRNSPDQNIAALERTLLPVEKRWTWEGGKENLPTYPALGAKDYFSGKHGLPITGPMGRCLTLDAPRASTVTSDCDGRTEQDWRYVGNRIRSESKQACLTAGANGSAELAPCTDARNQLWAYTVRDAEPTRDWLKAELFGQIRPIDDPNRCLAAADDPFKDTMLQRNPVRVIDCASVPPRQMSWFIPTLVYTVRVALARFGHEPDHMPMAKTSDDALKAIFAEQVVRLSEQYRRMGVRFVFDPDHDFRRIDDPAAVDPNNGAAIASGIAKLAIGDFHGKIAVALTEKGTPGETSAWNVEYEPDRIADPVTGAKFDYARWSQDPNRLFDKAGLPALSDYIDFGGAIGFDLGATLRQTREFGHYFGLADTFRPDGFADIPEDIANVKAWTDAGAPPCGNLASVAINGKTTAPDRINIEGRWGCEIGRSLSSLTPMQLAKVSWVLRSQLNRIPLTACAPSFPYNADVVTCEDAESLALCKETSAYLTKAKGADALFCRPGGAIARRIDQQMKWVGVAYIFKSTPQGQALINALAGLGKDAKPAADKTYDDVAAALGAGKNVPLAQALINRIGDIHEMSARDHSSLTNHGFTDKPDAPLTQAELEALKGYAAKVLAPEFTANAPSVMK